MEVSSPRRMRLTSLSGLYVLKRASTSCSHAHTSATSARSSPAGRSSASSMLTAVPMTCSTWRTVRPQPCASSSAACSDSLYESVVNVAPETASTSSALSAFTADSLSFSIAGGLIVALLPAVG